MSSSERGGSVSIGVVVLVEVVGGLVVVDEVGADGSGCGCDERGAVGGAVVLVFAAVPDPFNDCVCVCPVTPFLIFGGDLDRLRDLDFDRRDLYPVSSRSGFLSLSLSLSLRLLLYLSSLPLSLSPPRCPSLSLSLYRSRSRSLSRLLSLRLGSYFSLTGDLDLERSRECDRDRDLLRFLVSRSLLSWLYPFLEELLFSSGLRGRGEFTPGDAVSRSLRSLV